MWEYMQRRVLCEAEYITANGATVRAAAAALGVSKSTVHKDVAERLKEIDASLYAEVKKVLSKNLAERHIRGGNATRIKYARTKGSSPAKK